MEVSPESPGGARVETFFANIMDWARTKEGIFYPRLRDFDVARRDPSARYDIVPEEAYSGAGLCEAASHVVAHAIKLFFTIPDDHIAVARGWYVGTQHNLNRKDGWVRIKTAAGSYFLHPTYGQFDPRFTRRMLMGFQGDESKLYHLKANPADANHPEGYEDFLHSIEVEEGKQQADAYRAIYDALTS